VFKLIHLGDTLVPVNPQGLPARLAAVGFVGTRVSASSRSLRFSARKPG
jgi:hypothetical protein